MRTTILTPLLFVGALLMITIGVSGQNDSIVFTNGNYIVGEIKNLRQGIMQVETDYSDSDFKVEWDQIHFVSSEQVFLLVTTQGDRYNGTIASVPGSPDKVVIKDLGGEEATVDILDVVSFKSIDQTFISRLSILLSLGYTLTKANNNQQFTSRAELGYLSNTFAFDVNFSMVRSFQEDMQDSTVVKITTRRTEGGAGLKFFFYRDWFAMVSTELLQSTEMQLDLRAVTKAGIGNFLVNNQQMYLILSGGAAWNYEDYTNPDSTQINPRNSAEGFLGLEYNIFDIGDLDLKTSVFGYPSFTESGRFRTDFSFDLRYEFAFDLFFGIGFTLNYDSKPAAGSDPTDYVLQTSLGWEL